MIAETRPEASPGALIFEAVSTHGAIPGGVHDPGVVASAGSLFLFGGDCHSWTRCSHDGIYVLDIGTMRWEHRPMQGNGPTCTGLSFAMYHGGCCYGLSLTRPPQLMHCATEPNSCWDQIAVPDQCPLEALYYANCASLCVVLGIDYDGEYECGTRMLALKVTGTPPTKPMIRTLRGEAPQGRRRPAWCRVGSLIYMFGGWHSGDDKYYNDLYTLDVDRLCWTPWPYSGKPTEQPLGRSGAGLVYRDNRLYLFGGSTSRSIMSDEVWVFCLTTRVWTRTGMLPKPLANIHTFENGEDTYMIGEDEDEMQQIDTLFKLHFPLDPTKAVGALQTDLGRLMQDPSLCDVTFSVEGAEISSSRAILALRSSVMRAMLLGPFKEGQTQQPIKIEGLRHKAFAAMLQYMVTATVAEELTVEEAFELYTAADRYILADLKTICLCKVRKGLTEANVVRVVTWALESKCAVTKEGCVAFLHAGGRDMLDCPDLLNLPPEIFREWLRRVV